MKTKESGASALSLDVAYHCIRNISSPEDQAAGRSVYAGQFPVNSIVEIPTNENVRGFLMEAEGKQTRMPTTVHKAIRNTLEEQPDVFSVLNGGLVIVAKQSEIDEKAKRIKLVDPSIINGSQTQGVIRNFLRNNASLESFPHVKFELVITDDSALVAEISIARNFQNDVQSISIAGRRGQLDELEKRLQLSHPEVRLQKSETQRPSEDTDYLDTEKLLQVIAALLPQELWWKQGEFTKVYTYSQKATCLKDFTVLYKAAKSPQPEDDKLVEAYNFYLDIVGYAYNLYQKWKSHGDFAGTGLRSIQREGRSIKDVPDGIIFPIIAAHSEFVKKEKGKWGVRIPKELDDRELVKTAKSAYIEIADSKPMFMGKSKACYTALQQITAIYKKFAEL